MKSQSIYDFWKTNPQANTKAKWLKHTFHPTAHYEAPLEPSIEAIQYRKQYYFKLEFGDQNLDNIAFQKQM